MPFAKEGLKITRSCFVCEKSISSALTGKVRHELNEPPQGATCWQTQGNYGSVVYDPLASGMDEKLEICICDECLTKKRAFVYKFVEERQIVAISKW
jgi:hypothetical protein